GQYVAALCMNIDLTLFRGMQSTLEHFTKIETDSIIENLEPNGTEAIRRYIDQFASKHATTPRMLKLNERKQLIQELKNNGLLEIKKAVETVAQHLGISRASAYLYVKET
ncbi:helix-turn-helix domain-containing protein, partial [Acinetobacter baumannii]